MDLSLHGKHIWEDFGDMDDGLVADFEDSWLLVEFWSDFEQTCATESFLELTSKAQLG